MYVRMSDDCATAITALAKAKERSFAWTTRRILQDWLAQQRGETPAAHPAEDAVAAIRERFVQQQPGK